MPLCKNNVCDIFSYVCTDDIVIVQGMYYTPGSLEIDTACSTGRSCTLPGGREDSTVG